MTHYGGFGMPYIEKVIQTSRIKMLGRIMSGDKEKWKLLPLQYLNVVDKNMVLKMLSLKLLKVKMSLNLIKYQYITRK